MLSNPVYDPFQILTKIYSDGAHLKQAIADTYIEEQYRSRTVKIVYGVLENDIYFDYCIRHYAPKAPKLAVRILLKHPRVFQNPAPPNTTLSFLQSTLRPTLI